MEPFIGQIILTGFNFAPIGWRFCDGSLLSIAENDALFALIGTTYGGDGQTTFALPDLRGRSLYGAGVGSEGISYVFGEQGGRTDVLLNVSQIPPHSHGMLVQAGVGTESDPAGRFLASAPLALGNVYAENGPLTSMSAGAVRSVGGNVPHDNEPPFLALNYLIAVEGIFPSRA